MTEFRELAEFLTSVTSSAGEAGTRLSETEWRSPWAPGKWTRLEVLGHLVDSAAHNHQRFARALHEPSITMPGYDPDAQVREQHYADAPVALVLDAWRTYNLLIASVVSRIPAEKETVPCTIGSSAPMTLRELAFDYVAHLEHHLRQIFAGREPLPASGMPWPPAGRWE